MSVTYTQLNHKNFVPT